ncbi:DNA repair protein RecN (Recombination protein N) [Parabacteroides sp. PF5-5]|uniref:DNA repair protein RecN n=1 Tax=unclassified Parabacteroides TaxID=2649774 RepID=UPI002476FAB3|nr:MULTISPECIES: DNA repair protein RecN [unclassified Parabacteroides]MDH6303979.1 DNA repair protein RecN (Recombination protein N) [Parabacteroides sp. PH5-39]MDH6314595.1 DNA repair protein RecN (Recombination protein N) [Parabacteroides sp. PF5-13]MDH6318340.1 DNA repair protein RecN (Recombination protein N) [Parabacteroides sp. PH5-13]MDH6322368.1 DNA repair protein RecN (Recombination protein N) [Parabacteroides sp. PH5-8]MDH6325553.1 DNA repair protein RecN (Recombination protein N) [
MLKSLYIQNYVLIDSLDIRFADSFTVITGETGAGKSIILGALGLVLGQRADSKSIKSGEEKCVIEAVFDVSKYQLQAFFQENELEYDSETCILRRELFASGKSRAFVNDSPASLTAVKELGNRLIDIHSQHQNLLLADNKFQLRVVDVMAQNDGLLAQYKKEYSSWQQSKRELKEVMEKASQAKQDEDYLRFQLTQLQEAKLLGGEQETLEQELETLSHAEDIKGGLYKITDLLNGDEQGSVQLLKDALASATALELYYPRAKEISERLRTAYIDLNDLASETDTLKEDIDFDPERLQWVNERLNMIYTLQQKHRLDTIDELLALQNTYQQQLTEIDSFDEQIEQLQKQTDTLHKELLKQAEHLSKQRKKASEAIAAELISKLSLLGMPNTRFRIDFVPRAEPENDGMDDIRFMFSANKSGDLERVAQTASGGEISRLMLCIKAMIAGFTALPAIIFDEVDMGVSGDIADKMGAIMQELGSKMQVMAITHLPQIASKGKEHYFVYKQDTADQTVTQIRKLTNEERIQEVARMLSGATLTEASVANAKELLKTILN